MFYRKGSCCVFSAGLWRQFHSGESGENKHEKLFPQRMNGIFTSSIHSQDGGFSLSLVCFISFCVISNVSVSLILTPLPNTERSSFAADKKLMLAREVQVFLNSQQLVKNAHFCVKKKKKKDNGIKG